jgi:hypothetical protein
VAVSGVGVLYVPETAIGTSVHGIALSLEGVEIVPVRTGAEALTAGQVDLVLLDLHLGHAYNPFDILNENRRPSTYAKPGRETVPSSRSPSTTVADISPAHRRRR